MENVWSKVVMGAVILIAVVWIGISFTGASPRQDTVAKALERQEFQNRVASTEINPETDADFPYKKYNGQLSNDYARRLNAIYETGGDAGNLQASVFYKPSQTPIVVRVIDQTQTTPTGTETMPIVTEEVAVFNLPQSITFVPDITGNIVKIKLAPLSDVKKKVDGTDVLEQQGDRHMVRLAATIERRSRTPEMGTQPASDWSEWKLVGMENIAGPKSAVLANQYIRSKLPSAAVPDADLAAAASRPAGVVAPRPVQPAGSGIIRVAPAATPTGGITRPATTPSTAPAGIDEYAYFDILYIDQDVQEKTEYQYRVKMTGAKTTAEARQNATGEILVIVPDELKKTLETFNNESLFSTDWAMSVPAATPKNLDIAFKSKLVMNEVTFAVFQLRYWDKEKRTWTVGMAEKAKRDDEIVISGRDPFKSGLVFVRLKRNEAREEKYMAKEFVLDPETNEVTSIEVERTRALPPEEVAVVKNNETGEEFEVGNKSFQDQAQLDEIRKRVQAARDQRLKKREEDIEKRRQERDAAAAASAQPPMDPYGGGGAPGGGYYGGGRGEYGGGGGGGGEYIAPRE